MLGELTASLADEFRRPLASVLDETSAIKRQLSEHRPELTKALSGLDNVIENGNRLVQATKLVRMLARKYTPDRSPTDPADALGAAAPVLSADAAFRGITPTTDLQPALLAVFVHKARFQQVIIDLVVNAFEIISETAPDVRAVIIKGVYAAEESLYFPSLQRTSCRCVQTNCMLMVQHPACIFPV
jgi:signal transduction histidine kinase